ncbi:MAG: efflux RND transporter periplasmic adaptor subunit [Planctomycetales bacterium]|nr:efflux RND transporter periplasmic adaptor subunit [Planctomycetales bacterium]
MLRCSRQLSAWLLAALLAGLGAASATAQPGRGAPPVVAARVVERELTARQSFVGAVTPVKRAVVGSAVAGRVIEVPIEAGQRVVAQQPLAQLLTETISLEIAAAEGELDLRRQQLEELENGTRPEEVRQAAAQELAAKARHAFLLSRYRRVKGLFERQSAITEDEMQEAEANALEAEQLYLQAKAAHELAVAGPREEVIKQARAQVQIQQAVVERLKDQRRKYTVRSKFEGYVVKKHTEAGDWLNQGDPVADVVSVDPIDVVVHVGERVLPHVKPKLTTQVTFPALPDLTFQGEVVATVPEGDLRTRTFPVKVRIANRLADGLPVVRPGMYARVMLPVGGTSMATLVPKDAVIYGGQSPMLFAAIGAVEPGQKVKVRPVPLELGEATEGLLRVTAQLQPNELVIVQGNERLAPGQEVTVTSIQ